MIFTMILSVTGYHCSDLVLVTDLPVTAVGNFHSLDSLISQIGLHCIHKRNYFILKCNADDL